MQPSYVSTTTLPSHHTAPTRLYHDSTFPPYCTYTCLYHDSTFPPYCTNICLYHDSTFPPYCTYTYVSTTTLPSHHTVPTHMSLPRLYLPTILYLHAEFQVFAFFSSFTQSPKELNLRVQRLSPEASGNQRRTYISKSLPCKLLIALRWTTEEILQRPELAIKIVVDRNTATAGTADKYTHSLTHCY